MAKDKKEMSTEELIALSDQLYKEAQYNDIIELLDNEILEQHNSEVLYTNRAKAYRRKKEYDKAIKGYNKAIELNSNYAPAYNNRGILWHDKDEHDKAITDYDKAIELNSNYAHAYNNRGILWHDKDEHDKAITDYDKAIELDHDYDKAYYNRGISWDNKEEYDKAIKDYTKAIELKPDYDKAYYNRGISWGNKEEYDKAIKDYTKAIELKPNFDSAYNNRGVSKENKGNYEEAIIDFEKTLAINPSHERAKRNKERGLTILGKEKAKKSESLYDLFNDAVKDLSSIEERAQVLGKSDSIMKNVIAKIQEHASANMDEELTHQTNGGKSCKLVAHYTKLELIDIVLNYNGDEIRDVDDYLLSYKESPLRFYNAIYMNDPEEGLVLLNCLKESPKDSTIEDSFNNGKTHEENNIYLGSFLPAKIHEDELVMWRTYGKDKEKNEASGGCFVISCDFFDDSSTSIRVHDREADFDAINNNQSLFRVIYYDKNKKEFVNESRNTEEIQKDIESLTEALKEFIDLKNQEPKSPKKDKAIDNIVYHIISEIRYFFKSADYAFENEVRVIQFKLTDSDDVKIDDNRGDWLPRRLYIESKKPVLPYIKKIILGPKVPNPKQWIYLDAIMKKKGYKDFELLNSKQKYQ